MFLWARFVVFASHLLYRPTEADLAVSGLRGSVEAPKLFCELITFIFRPLYVLFSAVVPKQVAFTDVVRVKIIGLHQNLTTN
jgi:hypothetical protein